MSFSRVYSAQTHLLKGQIVTVETDISRGLNAFSIVGLPDKAVEEAKDRVGSALKNSGFESPKHKNQKTVVALAPANIKKEGPFFDVAIALGYLLANGEIVFKPEGKIFLGELSLNGELQMIKGALPLTEEAKKRGFTEIYLPIENAKEAALIEDIKVYGIKNLKELINAIDENNLEDENYKKISIPQTPRTEIIYKRKNQSIDFSDVRGQESAKRGLEIAAAGGHNIAMSGPPGTGKTMLARVFTDLLPDLRLEEILEITGIHSIVGALDDDLVTAPPFRAPHHTASYVSLIGGGTNIKPGEVTLAHRGVLFLDEFPEFEKRVIESLRQPLEDNVVSISRAKGTALYPSNFILIAAMNPCPCGNAGVKNKHCVCKPSDTARYERKISGPIMDRIDIWVNVGMVDYDKLGEEKGTGENTVTIKNRVLKARKIQADRFRKAKKNITTNSDMNVKDLAIFAPLSADVKQILNQSAERLQLSARAYHRVIKLARTIADLEGSVNILGNHILEALQYRPKNN